MAEVVPRLELGAWNLARERLGDGVHRNRVAPAPRHEGRAIAPLERADPPPVEARALLPVPDAGGHARRAVLASHQAPHGIELALAGWTGEDSFHLRLEGRAGVQLGEEGPERGPQQALADRGMGQLDVHTAVHEDEARELER